MSSSHRFDHKAKLQREPGAKQTGNVTLIIESAAMSSSSLWSLSAAATSPSSVTPMTSSSSATLGRFRFFFDIDAVAYGSGHDNLLYVRVNAPFTCQQHNLHVTVCIKLLAFRWGYGLGYSHKMTANYTATRMWGSADLKMPFHGHFLTGHFDL